MSSDFNGNPTWWNTTASTGDIFLGEIATTLTATNSDWRVIVKITPDKNWMPYQYVEYEPKWHQKFASYKNQIEHMWD